LPSERRRPVRVLFNTWANRDNVNSQSLTAREIACRLDPERCRSSLFLGHDQESDPRLADQPGVRLIRVPPRLGSLAIAGQLLWGGHDVIVYPALNERASRLADALWPLARRRATVHCMEVSVDQAEAAPPAALALARRWVRRADRVTAITPAIARDLAARWGVEAEVVPLGVDLARFQPVDRGDHQPPWQVIYVASIQPRKQPHLVLELARRLAGEPVEFHLIGPVLGDADYHRRLLAEVERDGLTGVHFHGPLPQEEIRERLARADVYLLPSRLEGFAKTTLEAAATGLPAIVFADYETTAVADGESGFQVSTVDEMETTLRRLLADRELRARMGAAGRRLAEGFSWDGVARRWEAILTDLGGAP
jgi:glycosyltransferase involved in cell wall biosynthesis